MSQNLPETCTGKETPKNCPGYEKSRTSNDCRNLILCGDGVPYCEHHNNYLELATQAILRGKVAEKQRDLQYRLTICTQKDHENQTKCKKYEAAGICADCSAPAAKGRTRCEKHLAIGRMSQRKARARKRGESIKWHSYQFAIKKLYV